MSGRLNIARLDALGFSEENIERIVWWFVGLGIGLRALAYLQRLPIWTDEAKLATSLLDRGFAELIQPLVYGQVASFSFMWILKASVTVFGYSELSLRLVPALCGISGVLLMRHLARRLFGGPPMLFAVALFAVSYYPVRHSAELKPYAMDLFASLVLTVVAVEWIHRPERTRWLWLLAALAPLTILLSHPAILAAGGVLAGLAFAVWKERRAATVVPWLAAGLLAAGTFVTNFVVFISKQYEQRADMTLPWEGAFPPWNDPLGALLWVVQTHTGRTFGYPLGGEDGASTLTFAAFLVGAIVLFRADRRGVLPLLLGPFAVGFVAAVAHRYPYGGSGRVTQYLVPGICLLVGLGAARMSVIARNAARRRRAQIGVIVFFTVFGTLLFSALVLRPYRDRPDMLARDFARWFWHVKTLDGELVCAWDDLKLDFSQPARGWTPGGAGYRINQFIYFERRKSGEPPDLARLSDSHPLRVVFLGSTLHRRQDSLEAWLARMDVRYELLVHERHNLGGFEQQHRSGGDWIELYTFAPRNPPVDAIP